MTEDKAMAMLDALEGGAVFFPDREKFARTLKARLARPVLPEELSAGAINDMIDAWSDETARGSHNRFTILRACHRALYVHLTATATKEVEVWHVEAFRHQDGMPSLSLHTTRESADKMAWCLEHEQPKPRHFSCIRVTGPHKQTVPA